MKPGINEAHRKELLKFLLVKTAAVRSGVKPAELLRVQHCYSARNEEGFQFCLYRDDILHTMKLDFIELQTGENSSLILFYHRQRLAETLAEEENLKILEDSGYDKTCSSVEDFLKILQCRFQKGGIPHEVGVFIGYPAKDVQGFIANLPRTPVHKSDW